MKYLKIFIFSILITPYAIFAQSSEVEIAKTAIKSGSSKEISELFHPSFELVLLEKNYQKDKGEAALKDFFQSNPPKDFTILHKGESRDGSLFYSIGHYLSNGDKFRVVIRFKKSSGEFKLYKMEVSNL